MILEQNQGLSVICRNISAGPKRPTKALTIPKNGTGSGRAKIRRRSDELELDVGASCSERASVKRALSEMAEALAAVVYDQKRQE